MCNEKYICDLCGREVSKVTVHHLIPREEGGKDLATAMLCIPCHKQIHALYSNKELSVKLYTISRLRNDDKIIKYLKFIAKHPGDSHISVKKSKDVRKK
jgi:5-methylcytosine-specific restriction endonuclease McrA